DCSVVESNSLNDAQHVAPGSTMALSIVPSGLFNFISIIPAHRFPACRANYNRAFGADGTKPSGGVDSRTFRDSEQNSQNPHPLPAESGLETKQQSPRESQKPHPSKKAGRVRHPQISFAP